MSAEERSREEWSAFISWRMNECKRECKLLEQALEAEDSVKPIVIRELPGGDLRKAVTAGMKGADLIIVMGTRTYGKETSGTICTNREMSYFTNKATRSRTSSSR